MNFLSVKQYSQIWEISERRIIKLCTEGRIPGAVKSGRAWKIPENTMKPADKRNNVSKYINTEKRIAIFNFNKDFGYNVISLLEQAGFLIDVISDKSIEKVNLIQIANDNAFFENLKSQTNKYYDGLIYIEDKMSCLSFDKIEIIKIFAEKMNCTSSIVYVNTQKNMDLTFIKDLSKSLKAEVGSRINAISLNIPNTKNLFVEYEELANDIVDLLTRLKNTTGFIIETDVGVLEFDKSGKTKILSNGEFYKAIDNCLNKLDKQSYFWSASMMLQDEWTEEPKEMKFRVSNLEVANRGAKVERIFVFSHSKIKDFKSNKTLKIFMQSNIDAMYVDLDEILKKEPKLLEILGDGWDGIDESILIVDTPTKNENEARGYLSTNKLEIQKAYECYLKLKSYSKKLKDILK